MRNNLWKKIIAMAAVTMVTLSSLNISTVNAVAETVTDKDFKESELGGEQIYTDGTKLEVLKEFSSPDGKISAKVQSDKKTGRVFYSVSNNDECVIYASLLGIVTEGADFTNGADYVAGSVKSVTDTYTLLNGKRDGKIVDKCNEYSFNLIKDGKELKVHIRAYDDGIAYNYAMNEGTTISKEASEFVFSNDSILWSYKQPNVTYEGTYQAFSMENVYNSTATYTTPSLIKSGDNWVLLTEASVFDDEENYCASCLKTTKDSKNLRWVFGNKQTKSVVLKDKFETPWRVAVIGSDLNTIVNNDIVTSVCNDAKDMDYSFVKPGKLAWSWWSSTGDNPIAFEPQYEYIDFAAENGWEYVCLDYGWVLWKDYKNKVKELVDYAAEKNVGIWLWYGVNNVGHSAAGAYPKYSLLNEATIRTEMEWANSIGVKGVKVDYYESDNQATMNQMKLCAEIAAENEIMVLFHGCTSPSGENRTYPNVISYEAVYGAEYYKWRTEPSTANVITYLFTRNAVGSADFTPTALPVAGIKATHGFMLATTVYVESGVIHFAENVNVYEGYAGLSLMNDIPATWNETIVSEGYPGKFGSVARRSDSDWYVASLTKSERTTEISLDFLDAGKEYTAYIYKTKPDKKGIEVVTKKVTKNDKLAVELGKDDGFTAKITMTEFDCQTNYEKNNHYFEAEAAVREGNAKLSASPYSAQYSSGCQLAEYIGGDAKSAVVFKVNAPKTGVYEIGVHYVSGADRRFCISVNGDDKNRIRTSALNSGDWVSVKKETIYLKLKEGENTIKFYNDEAFAPNLDRISVSKQSVDKIATESDETKDNITSHPGSNYKYTYHEAEIAKIVAGATNEGDHVGWIGGKSYVLFDKIKAEKAGKYYLSIYYMTGADRTFAVSVNDEKNIMVQCPTSGDYHSNPAIAYVEVELKEGINTIKMSNPSGDAPNLDKIGISKNAIGVSEEDDTTDTSAKPVEKDNTGNVYKGFIILSVSICVILITVIFVLKLKKKKGKN